MKDYDSSLVGVLIEALKPTVRAAILEALREVNPGIPGLEDDICCIDEVAALTGLKKSTIYVHCYNARHNPEKLSIPSTAFWRKGKRLYFSRAAVRDWINEGRV